MENKMEHRKMKGRIVFLLAVCFFGGIPSSFLFAAGTITLKTGGDTIVVVKGNHTVLVQGEEYKYQRLKKDKRLKIFNESTGQGLWVKRYGTKIRIRDLRGNLLHLIIKAGYYYKVKTVMGTELAVMKREPDRVTVTVRETKAVYIIEPGANKTVCHRANGTPVFTLEGDAKPFPASFFAMNPLSLLERTACYLMYR